MKPKLELWGQGLTLDKGKDCGARMHILPVIEVFLKFQPHSEFLYFDTSLASAGENLH